MSSPIMTAMDYRKSHLTEMHRSLSLHSYDSADMCGTEMSVKNSLTLPSHEEAFLTANSNVSVKKTEMELYNELEGVRDRLDEARDNGNALVAYEILTKLYKSAMESHGFIIGSHYLEELEAIEYIEPSLRGRSYKLTMEVSAALGLDAMPLGMDSSDYTSSDEEESSDLEDESIEMIEPRWILVFDFTPVRETPSLSSELVNNIPEGYEVRLTGKKKDNRVKIDRPYKGWISIEGTSFQQTAASPARTASLTPLEPSSSATPSITSATLRVNGSFLAPPASPVKLPVLTCLPSNSEDELWNQQELQAQLQQVANQVRQ